MTKQTENVTGKVYLVGAGPGDPGLITLRAAACLGRSDVVLYDYLANPAILSHVASHAKLICMGKHGRTKIWSQTEINEKLVELALAGNVVTRLKGGDPAVFARGVEEVETLVQAGITYEIVPGITTALAAGSCAGIPITHRDMASAVALVTGQENPSKQAPTLDYGALATFPGTLVFYMGVTTVQNWSGQLLAAGKDPETSCAIVRRCSLPDQQVIQCTLGTVVETIQNPPIVRPPAIVIVGDVAQLRPKLSWFEHRPLFGQSVLVTRPSHQASQLANPMAELGAEVLFQPAIQIEAAEHSDDVEHAIGTLDQFDWLVFSSRNGVQFFFERLFDSDRDLRSLAGLRIAAIGPGTRDALADLHLTADLVPDEYRAESLAAALVSEGAASQKFLLVRASRGREVLSEQLADAGGKVQQIVVYRSSDVTTPDEDIVQRMQAGDIHWVTVTSSAIANSVVNLFGDSLRHTKIASISPITSDTLRKLGFEPAVEASAYTMPGVVQAIVDA